MKRCVKLPVSPFYHGLSNLCFFHLAFSWLSNAVRFPIVTNGLVQEAIRCISHVRFCGTREALLLLSM